MNITPNSPVAAIGVCLGLLAIAASGCATNRVSLIDKGVVSLETVPNERADILWADVYVDGEDNVVYGTLQRRSHTSYPIKTHVDVTISSPDGVILEQSRTPDIYVPRRRPGKGISFKRFKSRFANIPTGSKVTMAVHDDPHETVQ